MKDSRRAGIGSTPERFQGIDERLTLAGLFPVVCQSSQKPGRLPMIHSSLVYKQFPFLPQSGCVLKRGLCVLVKDETQDLKQVGMLLAESLPAESADILLLTGLHEELYWI